jgi:alkanesulfonate monooxygenase SsuD/methylene tetrahydromethanopterin reductase-like flavin-dependent oxidoreductase (luciferase family)
MICHLMLTHDVLSNGRAIAGLGIGWSKDEYDVSGVPYKQRGERANEFLQLLKRIWTDEVVEFKGQFYSIPASQNFVTLTIHMVRIH